MKRGRFLLAGAIVVAALCMGLMACGNVAPTDEPKENTTTENTTTQTEKPIGVAINLADDSILTFDGSEASAQLVEDMREGKTPTSCTVLYDQMGGRPAVTVTDARTIRDVYKKLALMHVGGETKMSITDCYHLVSFELQDGTVATYNFEGEEILVRKNASYEVSDDGHLWPYVQDLQDQYLEEQNADPDSLAITLEDEDEMVTKCPKSAVPGETVQVKVYTVLDAERHVSVNGDEYYGEFVGPEEFEFVMPNTPVTVHVWISSDEYTGA